MKILLSSNYEMSICSDPSLIKGSYEVKDDTAYIRIYGSLVKSYSWSNDTYVRITENLGRAVSDPNVTNLVFMINSPGGEVAGLDICNEMIRTCPKKTTAYINGICASGAYLLASACNQVVASEGSMVGSIGAMLVKDKLWGEFVEVFVGQDTPYKNTSSKEVLQEQVNSVSKWFLSKVGANRNIGEGHVGRETGGGRMFLAMEALSMGLIDQVGFLDSLEKPPLEVDVKDNGEKISSEQTETNRKEQKMNQEDLEKIKASSFEEGRKKATESLVGLLKAMGGVPENILSMVEQGESTEKIAIKALEEKNRLGLEEKQQLKAKLDQDTKVGEEINKIKTKSVNLESTFETDVKAEEKENEDMKQEAFKKLGRKK